MRRRLMGNKDSNIDLSLLDIYGNPWNLTTANCYVVKEAGEYKFPCVYGNAISNGMTNSAAYTKNVNQNAHAFVNYKGNQITNPYITTDTGESINSVQLSIADNNNIFTNISASNSYVKFKVASVPATGANGVISIKNSSGVIMWSWHIWVWPHDLTPITITNLNSTGYKILPVNLASVLDSSDSINKTTGWRNWYYQLSRPTPSIPPTVSYNSTTKATTYGALNFTYTTGSYYKQYITSPTTYFSSLANEDTHGYLWHSTTKTVYDPCPPGFKIPPDNTFTGFWLNSAPLVVGSFSNGYRFKKNSSDTTGIFFPASGNYNNNEFFGVGTNGYVWTSYNYFAQNLDIGGGLTFYNSNVVPKAGLSIYATCSVRPVAEEESFTGTGTVTVNLNSQWLNTLNKNPDVSLYDLYCSYSNKGVDNSVAKMTITISGYDTFTCYIRSYAESNFDYVMISQLDTDITNSSNTEFNDESVVKAHTRGNQQSGTALSNYTVVTYSNLGGKLHVITVVYRKDVSTSSGDDCGYLLIPKSN